MKWLSLEEQRKRIDNINHAEKNNRKFLRRHRIRDYLPGQATYTLGDYPARFSIEPTEYDYNMLKDMAENGVELIQLHEEWNDAIRRFGADKFSSFDPQGLQKFVDLCHSFGIKVIAYASSGYFNEPDPDFREEFARKDTSQPRSFRYCSIISGRTYSLSSTLRTPLRIHSGSPFRCFTVIPCRTKEHRDAA